MGSTIWLTGLSGAGKTTLAHEMKKNVSYQFVIVDGDELRLGINKNLGFSDEDRKENIFRAAHICKLLNDNNINVIACIMSPTEEQREMAKEIIGQDKFFLGYVRCDMDTLIQRDTKGLYAKYLKGEIKNMVGFDLPYEQPLNENICIDTRSTNVTTCATKIIDKWLSFRFNF